MAGGLSSAAATLAAMHGGAPRCAGKRKAARRRVMYAKSHPQIMYTREQKQGQRAMTTCTHEPERPSMTQQRGCMPEAKRPHACHVYKRPQAGTRDNDHVQTHTRETKRELAEGLCLRACSVRSADAHELCVIVPGCTSMASLAAALCVHMPLTAHLSPCTASRGKQPHWHLPPPPHTTPPFFG